MELKNSHDAMSSSRIERAPAGEVRLELTDGRFRAEIIESAGGDAPTYAFYLRRDGERTEASQYSPAADVVFKAPPLPGTYTAVAFRRHGDGSTDMLRSASLHVAAPKPGKRLELPEPARLDSLEAVEQQVALGGPARFDVRVQGLDYALLLGPRKPGGLFVILGGAVPDRRTITLPRFSRYSWVPDLPGTVLCVADPSLLLDADLRLGWYFGTLEHDGTATLATIVQHVARGLGVPADQITAYGSSGGGFAALQLAGRLGGGATAVAINAQTDVLKYGVRKSVAAFVNTCLHGLDEAAARERLDSRLSSLALWSGPQAASARCLLVQNSQDRHHFRTHFTPFAQQFGMPTDSDATSEDGRMATLLYSHPSGHAAEPREMLPRILGEAARLRRA
jgi:hypothetical protein